MKEIWLMPFRLITAVMDIFGSNRDHFRRIRERRLVAGVLKYGAVITLMVWLVLALLAGRPERDRLSESLKQLWPETVEPAPESPAEQPDSR